MQLIIYGIRKAYISAKEQPAAEAAVPKRVNQPFEVKIR